MQSEKLLPIVNCCSKSQVGLGGLPVIVFMTSANHRLLHDYIDSVPYHEDGAYLRRLLQRNGERVLDLDAAFPADEFIDNDHLTAAGQRRLVDALAAVIPR